MSDVAPYSRLAGVYDEIVVDPCHERWAAFLHGLWASDPVGVTSVLDVCCGTGLMAAELDALGYRVLGVDAAPDMLQRARERLGPDVPLLQQTLPDLTVSGPFDAVVSTFDGLNYLPPADFEATLAAVADRLRPGGWLVFDLHTDVLMQFTAANPVVTGEADGWHFVISSEVDLTGRACDTRIELSRDADGDTFTELHRQYFHSTDAVLDALRSAGLHEVVVTDEYTHDPVGDSTLRATWVARRRSSA